ncbi:MAG: thermonuclease family protein [Methyloligellaceae bacterium]
MKPVRLFSRCCPFAVLVIAMVVAASDLRSTVGSYSITGKAEIVDGDTLIVGGVRIRLYGIDAPEAGQKCKRNNGKTWACGKAAIEALTTLVEGKEVSCESKGQDDYDRVLYLPCG